MLSVILFGTSLFLLASFLLFKEWEVARRRRFLPTLWARADALVIQAANWLQHGTPRPHPDWVTRLSRFFAHEVAVVLLHLIHFLERRLLGLVNMIKGKGTVKRGETASEYLRSVSEHKKNGKGYIIE